MERSSDSPVLANGGCSHDHNGTLINGADDQEQPQEDSGSGSLVSSESGNNGNLRRGDRCAIRLRSMVVVFEEDVSVGGKLCKARLEDDHIEWATGKGKSTLIYFTDILAGTLSCSKAALKQKSSATTPPRPTIITLHVFQHKKPGDILKIMLSFNDHETCYTWNEQIQHKMQSASDRPRRLYVIVNPSSGKGHACRTWFRVESMFNDAMIKTDVVSFREPGQAKSHLQRLDLSQYDGIIGVGGDGLFNEILNGVLLQSQYNAGVNIKRARFIPVQPFIRLGMIPAGTTDSVVHSSMGYSNPVAAAAQIILGYATSVDVCSLYHDGQLLMFSAAAMNFGIKQDPTTPLGREYQWIGRKSFFDSSAIKAFWKTKTFEGELSYVECEEKFNSTIKCSASCQICGSYDASLDSPSLSHDKGATVTAVYTEVDRAEEHSWEHVNGEFCCVVVAPHVCSSHHNPGGLSPTGHLGNGCVDLIIVKKQSVYQRAKLLLHHKTVTPTIIVKRVKEFKFRELSNSFSSSRRSPLENDDGGYLMPPASASIIDEDEITNHRAGQERAHSAPADQISAALPERPATLKHRSAGPDLFGSLGAWNVDGDELQYSDLDVRVHRQLISLFAYGVETSRDRNVSLNDTSCDDSIVLSSNKSDSISPRPSLSPHPSPNFHPSPSPWPSPSPVPLQSTEI